MLWAHSKGLILTFIKNPSRLLPNWGPGSGLSVRYPNLSDALAAVGILNKLSYLLQLKI